MSPELLKVREQRDTLRAQLDLVRTALVGMIGGDGTDYLDSVERSLLDGPAPSEKSRGELLEAIRALRETLPALALRPRNGTTDGTDGHGYEAAAEMREELDVERAALRIAGQDATRLRKALAELVGADGPKDLRKMELALRTMPMPDEDRVATLNAVILLRDTWPMVQPPVTKDGLALPGGGSAFSQAAAGMESGFDAVPAAPGEEVRL